MSFVELGAKIGAANLAGIAIYMASALVAIVAASRLSKTGAQGWMIWLGVAALFLGLALFRFANAEEALRQWLRSALAKQWAYEARRPLQTAAILALIGAAIAALSWAVPRIVHRPRWQVLVAGSVGMFALLYSLRIISLHGVDQVLYASLGPLHLNHLLELLPILAIWHAAWLCLAPPRARPRPSRTSGRRQDAV